ncbi:hypothetical protein JIN85_09570 [Luteolibacter pohnpeiensis]|uniref:Uncharacterized protein n=1 Tax=Luteolibacter pohnpeiensis TaxID=454153 RepID=A0A934VVX1_9BACT|nr:hypothetical protein [Luteolibacter pohnpeiensis]
MKLKNGTLEGLPKVFQPARFDLEKKVLTIGGKDLQLPPVVERLFPDAREEDIFGKLQTVEGVPYDLTFSASWYHGPSMLPPYLRIRITPKERDFRFEILVDIQAVKLLDAEMIVSLSPNSSQSIPIAIKGSNRVIPFDGAWESAIGTWQSGTIVVNISQDAISATDRGKAVEYPAGAVSVVKPGVMSLRLPDGAEEEFEFLRSGDILNLYLKRGGFELVLVGSETYEFYQRLNQEAEQGSAGQPASRSEPDLEGGDKPQPKSEERSR